MTEPKITPPEPQTDSPKQWDETLASPEGQAILEELVNDAMDDIDFGNVKPLPKFK
jgi:hypothetical protein